MSSPEVPQPHDSLIRHTFGQIQHAASFFQENLPAALASALQWDALELLNDSFVDEELRQSESDLLYQVPFAAAAGGEPLLLYLLFEHQSSPDRWMPLRLLQYMVRVWKRHLHENPSAEGLPPIVPLVLAQVAGGWSVSRQFHDRVQWPKAPGLRECLEAHQPRFEHTLVDLAGIELSSLRGGPVARLTQGLLKLWIDGDDGAWLDWALPILVDAEQARSGRDALHALYVYMFRVVELNFEDFRAKMAGYSNSRETAENIMTMATQLRNEGREEGLREGLKEGMIGQVQMLQRLLGRVPEPASVLAKSPNEELELMIARLEMELSTRSASR